MFDEIHRVVQINLEHRRDRKMLIEKELKVFPMHKVIRFDAIKDVEGYIGCTKSHIAVLKMAIEHKWPNVLIVEDDMQWKNLIRGLQTQNEIQKRPWDVILFGGTQQSIKPDRRIESCNTTTAYFVKQNQYAKLLRNFEEGLSLLQKTRDKHKYCIDQQWKLLQKEDQWYLIQMTQQRPSYSDIEKKDVNYVQLFR